MNILGIETSCDETAAAIVKNGKTVLSNIIVSSLKEHRKYGGIIPEIASRRQLEFIKPIVTRALDDANITLANIDAIAVTLSPGLIGSLLVGISFARALSFAAQKPLISVNHIKAHAFASFLQVSNDKNRKLPTLPAVALVVSGGHTNLYYIKNFSHFHLLGQTLDDAAGEAFDKVAKILDLGYPGGPVIDRLAKTYTQQTSLRFPCAKLKDTFNFSFSGTKTAVLYHHRAQQKEKIHINVAETVYAFQDSVVNNLTEKSLAVCRKFKTNTLVIGGGVAANSALREKLTQTANKEGVNVYFPPMSLCTDNAAMIAGLGYYLHKTPTKKE